MLLKNTMYQTLESTWSLRLQVVRLPMNAIAGVLKGILTALFWPHAIWVWDDWIIKLHWSGFISAMLHLVIQVLHPPFGRGHCCIKDCLEMRFWAVEYLRTWKFVWCVDFHPTLSPKARLRQRQVTHWSSSKCSVHRPKPSPCKGATVYTQVGLTSFLDLNPPNPLKKLAQIRILVPLSKGDLGGFTPISILTRDVYTR